MAGVTPDEGRPLQISTAELLADLEATLLELYRRLDTYREVGASDVVAADEGYSFAAGLEVTLTDGVRRAEATRAALAESQRHRDG